MLYYLVKILARLAIHLYCRDIAITKKELLQCNGPLLLAVNHPNSFLDAIILCTLFDKPVYSLARGDAFKNKWIAKILFNLKLLPVYRVSEGVENVEGNYKTFDQCKAIFKQNGIVLIFSEGLCINEWHLRSLKKGTARLAISSWGDGIPLKVLPIGINYSSFRKFGKNIKLFLGDFITVNDIIADNGHGKLIQSFNSNLLQQLQPFVFEINKNNKEELLKAFYIAQPLLKKIFLFTPAAMGWLLHAPFYYPVKKFVLKNSGDADYYDSIVVGIFVFVLSFVPHTICFRVIFIYAAMAFFFSITGNFFLRLGLCAVKKTTGLNNYFFENFLTAFFTGTCSLKVSSTARHKNGFAFFISPVIILDCFSCSFFCKPPLTNIFISLLAKSSPKNFISSFSPAAVTCRVITKKPCCGVYFSMAVTAPCIKAALGTI